MKVENTVSGGGPVQASLHRLLRVSLPDSGGQASRQAPEVHVEEAQAAGGRATGTLPPVGQTRVLHSERRRKRSAAGLPRAQRYM